MKDRSLAPFIGWLFGWCADQIWIEDNWDKVEFVSSAPLKTELGGADVGDKMSDEERDVFMEALDELPRLYYGRGSGAGDSEVLACIDTLHRLAHKEQHRGEPEQVPALPQQELED